MKSIKLTEKDKEELLSRFLRYVKFDTQSNLQKADSGIFPSTESQKEFAKVLADEMKNMGIPFVSLDKNFYILARIPASKGFENSPSIGFAAHYDTAGDVSGANVKAIVHKNYNGSKIELNENVYLCSEESIDLKNCIGKTIISSDGTTLLGADNKAGIASILTMVKYLLDNPEFKHGQVEVLFTPDEETGHGMDYVPLDEIESKVFYTVDGGGEGEVQIECFNAWKTEVEFTGIAAHLGDARGKMVNALTMAANYISLLPLNESPEATDNYYGYFCPLFFNGTVEKASLTVFTRDFDSENIKQRLKRLDDFALAIESRFPKGSVKTNHICQYKNMKEKIEENPKVYVLLEKAAMNAGVEPRFVPIRGGTDGSRLTELGIPTPNIFTGGYNFHSRNEWLCFEELEKSVHLLINLIKLWRD